jgi:hypothetical protein
MQMLLNIENFKLFSWSLLILSHEKHFQLSIFTFQFPLHSLPDDPFSSL